MKVWRYDLVPEGGFDEGHYPGQPGYGYEATAQFEGADMPRDAQILSYNITTKGVSVYALTEGVEGADTKPRTFFVCGNDVELPDALKDTEALNFRGTAKITGGPTAHVFELTHVTAEQS